MQDNALSHYGVKGMRWGRRKARTTSTDHKRASKLKRKHLSEMSNEDLKALNNRMNLESNYRNLKRNNVNRGRKLANDILVGTGKEIAKDALKKYIVNDVKKWLFG